MPHNLDRFGEIVISLLRKAHRLARQSSDYAALKVMTLALMVSLGASIGTFAAVDRLIRKAEASPAEAVPKSAESRPSPKANPIRPVMPAEQKLIICVLSSTLTLVLGGIVGAIISASYRRKVPRDMALMASRIVGYLHEHEGAFTHGEFEVLFKRNPNITSHTRNDMIRRWRRRHYEGYPGADFISEGPSEEAVFLGVVVSLLGSAMVLVICYGGSSLTKDVSRSIWQLDLDFPLTGLLLLVVLMTFVLTMLPLSLLAMSARLLRARTSDSRRFNISTRSGERRPEITPPDAPPVAEVVAGPAPSDGPPAEGPKPAAQPASEPVNDSRLSNLDWQHRPSSPPKIVPSRNGTGRPNKRV